jgi:hypothetical protein
MHDVDSRKHKDKLVYCILFLVNADYLKLPLWQCRSSHLVHCARLGNYFIIWKMPSWTWRHVALVETSILEEHVATIIKVKWISELGTVLAVQHHIQEDCILHRHNLENLKSYLLHYMFILFFLGLELESSVQRRIVCLFWLICTLKVLS